MADFVDNDKDNEDMEGLEKYDYTIITTMIYHINNLIYLILGDIRKKYVKWKVK